jgi:signal transduction histidine kinase
MDGLQGDVANAVWSSLEEVERLSKIVNSLLVISHLDYGDAGMEKSCVDLGVLAGDTAEQMQALAEDKSIAIESRSESVKVLGDETRLRQVIANLLDNAIKYTNNGGHIQVRVAERGNRGLLQVSDDGIGIPGEALPHIFERFYRADKARSRSSGGVGLGLSIVKAICSAHSGEVSVTSTIGKGTTLSVEFPLYTSTHEGRSSHEEISRTSVAMQGSLSKDGLPGPRSSNSDLHDEETSIEIPPSLRRR